MKTSKICVLLLLLVVAAGCGKSHSHAAVATTTSTSTPTSVTATSNVQSSASSSTTAAHETSSTLADGTYCGDITSVDTSGSFKLAVWTRENPPTVTKESGAVSVVATDANTFFDQLGSAASMSDYLSLVQQQANLNPNGSFLVITQSGVAKTVQPINLAVTPTQAGTFHGCPLSTG